MVVVGISVKCQLSTQHIQHIKVKQQSTVQAVVSAWYGIVEFNVPLNIV